MSRTKSAESKPTATRLYIVRDRETSKPVALVDAQTAAQARTYVAESKFTIAYAEQADVFEAAKAGLEPQKSGAVDESGD